MAVFGEDREDSSPITNCPGHDVARTLAPGSEFAGLRSSLDQMCAGANRSGHRFRLHHHHHHHHHHNRDDEPMAAWTTRHRTRNIHPLRFALPLRLIPRSSDTVRISHCCSQSDSWLKAMGRVTVSLLVKLIIKP